MAALRLQMLLDLLDAQQSKSDSVSVNW